MTMKNLMSYGFFVHIVLFRRKIKSFQIFVNNGCRDRSPRETFTHSKIFWNLGSNLHLKVHLKSKISICHQPKFSGLLVPFWSWSVQIFSSRAPWWWKWHRIKIYTFWFSIEKIHLLSGWALKYYFGPCRECWSFGRGSKTKQLR